MGGGPPKQPQFVLRQVENLRKMEKLLEGIVGQKQTEVTLLQEKLIRLKHGGGS